MLFLYNADPEQVEQWRELLAARVPDLQFVVGLDAVDPAQVDYMLTWEAVDGLERFSKLRVLFSAGAGVDQFDLSRVPEGVSLVRMVESSIAEIMAEYVAFAVLALHRDMFDYRLDQAARRWEPRTIIAARRRRVGVMGIGNLGRVALQRLQALGFDVRGWNRSAREIDGVPVYVGAESLPEFLAENDILVNLLPLTEATRGLFDRALFERLPRGAGLVNTGRGGHVVEADLLAALDSGQLSGAVLDVLQQEPPDDSHPFWSHPRIWLTPHIASTMQVEGGVEVVVDNLDREARGLPLLHTVDRATGY